MSKLRVGLIDGDMIAFGHSAAEEYGKEDADISFTHIQMSMDAKLEYLKNRLKLDLMYVFISGDDNFRFVINPEYKANRDGVWRPANLDNAKAHLRTCWDAMSMRGLEADDLIACFARYSYDVILGKHNKIRHIGKPEKWPEGTEIYICSLDKDLKQIPSINYRWETTSKGEKKETISGFGTLKLIINATGKTVKKEVKGVGTKFFLWQLLTGDNTDGIIGCGKKVKKIYQSGKKIGQEYEKREGVGAIEAYELLEKCACYKDGLHVVISQYKRIFGSEWHNALVTAGRQLYMVNTIIEDKALLWHFDGTKEYYDLVNQRIITSQEQLAA
jgi:5'-3' exonuclease